jgi:predicted dehydrogenase
MVRVGIVGIGFMGMIHYLNYQQVKGAKVSALCEVNEKRLAGDWRDIKGNFGPAGQMMDLSGIATYTQLDDMLADPDIDLVDVCLPPAAHADVVIKALESGKHVFCEKPMALDIASADRMVAAAAATGKLLMIGHVLPLLPEYQFAVEAAQSGKYGKLLGGHFKRVISDPQWLPHFYDSDKVGGPMLDLHIHDAHFVRLMFGMPTALDTQGRWRGEVLEYFQTQFRFADPSLVVSATSGVINQQGRSFLHGYELHFEDATLVFEFGVLADEGRSMMPLTVIPRNGDNEQVDLGSGDPMMSAFENELTAVATAVEGGTPSEFLTADLARDAIRICHKQNESARSGKRAEF